MSDIKVIQYSNDSQKSYVVKLFDAFPIAMSPMQLSWADDRIHELQVTFAYTKWRTYVTDANQTSINTEIPPTNIPSAVLDGTPAPTLPTLTDADLNFPPPQLG